MKTVLTFALVASLAAGAALVAQTRSPADLFQEALHYEEVKGDLQRAIAAYQTILDRFPHDRSVGAKAQFQMALCYERLGRPEAVAAYEKVVREYADQSELVTRAKSRLAALNPRPQAGSGLLETQVWTGPGVPVHGGISRDGRHVAYVDDQSRTVAVRDLKTGQYRVLSQARASERGIAHGPVISPDGQYIAFGWEAFTSEGDRLSINLVRFDGTGLQRLNAPHMARFFALSWAPNSKGLAAIIGPTRGTSQIALLSLDGSVTQLQSFPHILETASFSPDGKYLAIEGRLNTAGPDDSSAIVALAVDGSGSTPLVHGPAGDWYQPVWTPDGRAVVFSSSRSGRSGLWAVHVTDGKPSGDPVEIRPNIGMARIVGFSKDGTLFYGLTEGSRENYVASVDPVTLSVTSAPRLLSDRGTGSNSAPHWSPDGRSIAFLRNDVLVIRSVANGVERVLPANVKDTGRVRQYGMSWFPDSRSLLIRDNHPSDRERIVVRRVDVETGKDTVLFEAGQWDVWPPMRISPDGATVFYSAIARDTLRGINHLRLVKRDLASGRETEIFQRESGFYSFYGLLVAPDGRHLVFLDGIGSGRRTLVSLPIQGGAPSELWPTTGNQPAPTSNTEHWSRSWTPDGRFLLSRTADGVWALPAAGGSPRKLDWPLPHVGELSPDGKQTVYPVITTTRELRTIENLLSRIPGAR